MMTEIKTCEQYVLAELKRLQDENEALRERVSELKEETHRIADDVDVRFGGTVETARLSVASLYTIRNRRTMTADEIRGLLSDGEKLEAFADSREGYFPILNVETEEWPFSLEVGENVYACRVDDGKLEIRLVRADESGFAEGELYHARHAGAVRAAGLQVLAEELQDLLEA